MAGSVLPSNDRMRHAPATCAGWVAVTVTLALADFPSMVAVMLASPKARPVTRPMSSTVAMVALDECQDTARPGSGSPVAPRATAVSWPSSPGPRTSVSADNSTDATGSWGAAPSRHAIAMAQAARTPTAADRGFIGAIFDRGEAGMERTHG